MSECHRFTGRTVGVRNVRAFHLNDALDPCGSKVDRHHHIGQGNIGLEAFGHFLNDDRWADRPGVLETPEGEDMYAANLKALKSLIGK